MVNNIKESFLEKKRIIVIQTGKLGDMVCTTPVFREIKNKYVNSELFVVGDSLNREVLKGNPNIDSYIEIKDLSQDFLKNNKFDIAILLNPNPSILWKLILARINKIIAPKVVNGFSPYQTKKYRFLLLFVTIAIHRMKHYAPQEYLNALQKIGVYSSDTKKDLYINPEVISKLSIKFSEYKDILRIAIAPGAGNKIKEWPPEKFAQLIMELNKQHKAVFFIIGGKQEEKIRNILMFNVYDCEIIDTVGKLSIDELKFYISHMSIFISADTGPIYIAEAFNIPTVDIIGPIDETEQPPRGDIHISVLPPNRKRPEMYVMNARMYNFEEASFLATSTPVSYVLDAVNALLKKIKYNV